MIEWPDLDPRLGLRRLGGWRPPDIADILECAERALERLKLELGSASSTKPVACCPPTLPLPPRFPSTRTRADRRSSRSATRWRASWRGSRATTGSPSALFSASINPRRPPLGGTSEPKLTAGFPYSVAHASEVATLLANLIAGGIAKKGLITDLDDTLWAGIVGEVGAENVSWGLESGSQRHGLYQQLLASLASAGVLIAVASRNDPALVAAALGREDLLIPAEALYPVEAHWGIQVGLDRADPGGLERRPRFGRRRRR